MQGPHIKHRPIYFRRLNIYFVVYAYRRLSYAKLRFELGHFVASNKFRRQKKRRTVEVFSML